jgi:hypothetical protein
MTIEQAHEVERLANHYGRTSIKEGFDHRVIHVTVPNGISWSVSEDGHLTEQPYNRSINWDL